jgi:hypothetical protein
LFPKGSSGFKLNGKKPGRHGEERSHLCTLPVNGALLFLEAISE